MALMEKQYRPNEFEGEIYALWEKSGAFKPKRVKGKKFTIIMPPPNANDPLHLGHAMFVTLEDILIRFHRMRGEETLWLPGVDHAGIETQFVFEKKLKNQGKSRFDYDRESLYQMIWEYVKENSGIAQKQMKKIGASADWSRFKFTLDKEIVEIVLDTFERLYRDELIYRDFRLVNYCTGCGTAFSELEIIHKTRRTPLFYLKYGPLALATVRPETKFGDTGVAVNPKDRRYQSYIGKEIEADGLNGKFRMRVVADDYVDPEFGTGVVKVTPAHDINDFEIWQRHKAEIPGPKQVIGFDGKLNELTGKFQGLRVNEARKAVVEELKKMGLLIKIEENYEHATGVCYRCGTTLEPLPLPQFYLKVKSLAKAGVKALNQKQVRVHGKGFDKILKHWLVELKDWNISRQIVWGIRIPVWYEIEKNLELSVSFKTQSGKVVTGQIDKLLVSYQLEEIKSGLQRLQAPMGANFTVSKKSPGDNFLQETDTFDTWFSSAQWPYATLAAGSREDFKRYYPTSVMETGYDILPFWVMRMLMMGIYITGKAPFADVYLHGLVRDETGQKMSKSKGNVLDPTRIIEEYGADALRMSLVMSTTAGQDSSTGEGKIRGMRNLTNKIWNAARFNLMNWERENSDKTNVIGPAEKQYFTRLRRTAETVEKQLQDLKIGLAAETAYREFWHWYCDRCIEMGKKGKISKTGLTEGLITFIKILHPFIPFVTEAVYQELRKSMPQEIIKRLAMDKQLIIAGWPFPKKE